MRTSPKMYLPGFDTADKLRATPEEAYEKLRELGSADSAVHMREALLTIASHGTFRFRAYGDNVWGWSVFGRGEFQGDTYKSLLIEATKYLVKIWHTVAHPTTPRIPKNLTRERTSKNRNPRKKVQHGTA